MCELNVAGRDNATFEQCHIFIIIIIIFCDGVV